MTKMSDNVYPGDNPGYRAEVSGETGGKNPFRYNGPSSGVRSWDRCDACGRFGFDASGHRRLRVYIDRRDDSETFRCERPECDPVATWRAPVAQVAGGAGGVAQGGGADAGGALVARDPARGAPGVGAPRVAGAGNDAPNLRLASEVDGPDYELIGAAVDRAVRLAIEVQSMALLLESMPELRVPIRRLSERATEAQRAAETVLRCELGSHPLPRGGAR